jgi:Domain of unknown function (DUF4282)
MELGDLFSFDKKIAPSIIKPIYWIGLVLIVFVNVVYFFAGFGRLFTGEFFAGVWDMLAAIVTVVFGVLGLRVATELCLAVFEIHDKSTSNSTTQV